jgi:hypothetical protein
LVLGQDAPLLALTQSSPSLLQGQPLDVSIAAGVEYSFMVCLITLAEFLITWGGIWACAGPVSNLHNFIVYFADLFQCEHNLTCTYRG